VRHFPFDLGHPPPIGLSSEVEEPFQTALEDLRPSQSCRKLLPPTCICLLRIAEPAGREISSIGTSPISEPDKAAPSD
jgi:hypothetical protein